MWKRDYSMAPMTTSRAGVFIDTVGLDLDLDMKLLQSFANLNRMTHLRAYSVLKDTAVLILDLVLGLHLIFELQ
jgi:hypothetical protein